MRLPAGRREGWIALGLAALTVALSAGPRLYLWLAAPRGEVFIGEVWGAYDLPPYALLVRQAAAGSWFLDDRLIGPVHTAFFLYTPYILLGRLLGWTGLSVFAMLEVARWLGYAAALGAGWLFLRRALPPGRRAMAYFVALLAGGLGFLILQEPHTAVGDLIPLDVTAASFTVLNSLNMPPHIALSVALVAVYFWGLLAAGDGRLRGLWAAPALSAVASFHAFLVPSALVAGGLFFLWRGRRREVFLLLALATILSVPWGLYELSLSGKFPIRWNQDYAELESLPSLLISRALLWPFIGIGAWLAVRDRERSPGAAVALCWAGAALAFDLFPPFAQTELHRTVAGTPYAYGVLASLGLARLPRRPLVYLLAATLIGPAVETGLTVLAGPGYGGTLLPAGYLAAAQRLDAAGVTRCVMGADLAMRWVTVFSRSCDAEPDMFRNAVIVDRLAGAPAAQAPALLPHPDDLVLWGPLERRSGGPPALPVLFEVDGVQVLDGRGTG